MICHHCGAEMPEGTLFCTNCGSALPTAAPAFQDDAFAETASSQANYGTSASNDALNASSTDDIPYAQPVAPPPAQGQPQSQPDIPYAQPAAGANAGQPQGQSDIPYAQPAGFNANQQQGSPYTQPAGANAGQPQGSPYATAQGANMPGSAAPQPAPVYAPTQTAYQPSAAPVQQSSKAPLILGIVGIVLGVTIVLAPIGVVLGIIALVLGVKDRKRGGGIGGLVTGAIALVISALISILLFVVGGIAVTEVMNDPESLIERTESITDGSSSKSDSTSSSSSTSSKNYPITVCDDATATIVITSCEDDFADDPGYGIKITNNTNKPISVVTDYDSWTVDGDSQEAWLYEDVDPNKTVESFLWFDREDIGGGHEKLSNVKGILMILDEDSMDTLSTVRVTIP